jgi:mannosyl-3-phosphoglycerate phosphatase
VLALGPGRERLAEELAAVAARAGARIRRVSAMAARERPSLPGSPRLAEASYEYTEPFLVEAEADIVALQREAALRGQRIVRGPRYWHLCGGADKGLAVRTLLALYERAGLPPRTIGLGAWPTDVSLLRAVHRAVLLPGADGTIRPDVAAEVPRAERAAQGGPAGWSDAVIVALLGQQRVRAEGTLARIA